MTKGVTPHAMRGPERGRKGSVFCKCFCRYFLDSTSMCGMTKAGIPGSRIGVRDDQMTVSGAMTKARSPPAYGPAYGRKRKEKWRRGTNVGKRCLSRSVSVENLELYSQPNGCCKASPASSFSPDLAVIFQLSDISRELSFGFPFLLREKKRGDSGRTGRASLLARTVLLTVFFGYKPRLYLGFRVENRVTPHSDAGSRKKNLTSKLAGILWIPRRSAG